MNKSGDQSGALLTGVQAPDGKTEPRRRVLRYVAGMGRNSGEELQHSHLYAEFEGGDYLPMCRYGWNRSDGEAFSIFRGHIAARGVCGICRRNRAHGLPPVEARPGSHRTKWL